MKTEYTKDVPMEKSYCSNKWRADYYNFFTDKTWGDAKSYDLTLDSSLLPMEANVELVKTYLRLRGFID